MCLFCAKSGMQLGLRLSTKRLWEEPGGVIEVVGNQGLYSCYSAQMSSGSG